MSPVLLNPSRFGVPASYAAEVLADSPAVYARMNATGGLDSSGNGRNANVATYAATTGIMPSDPSAGAGLFNGSAQLAWSWAAWQANFTDFTAEFILKTTATTQQLLTARDYAGDRSWAIGFNGPGFANRMYFARIREQGGATNVVTAGTSFNINDGVARHFGLTYDYATGAMAITINGVVDATAAAGATGYWPSSSPTGLTVGYYQNTSGYEFNGVMQEYAFYNSKLSTARLLAHKVASGL